MPFEEIQLGDQQSQPMEITKIWDDHLVCKMSGIDVTLAPTTTYNASTLETEQEVPLIEIEGINVSKPCGLRALDVERDTDFNMVDGIKGIKESTASTSFGGGNLNKGDKVYITPPYKVGEVIYVTKMIGAKMEPKTSSNDFFQLGNTTQSTAQSSSPFTTPINGIHTVIGVGELHTRGTIRFTKFITETLQPQPWAVDVSFYRSQININPLTGGLERETIWDWENSVTYSTEDGTFKAGLDYTHTEGTLTFTAGNGGTGLGDAQVITIQLLLGLGMHPVADKEGYFFINLTNLTYPSPPDVDLADSKPARLHTDRIVVFVNMGADMDIVNQVQTASQGESEKGTVDVFVDENREGRSWAQPGIEGFSEKCIVICENGEEIKGTILWKDGCDGETDDGGGGSTTTQQYCIECSSPGVVYENANEGPVGETRKWYVKKSYKAADSPSAAKAACQLQADEEGITGTGGDIDAVDVDSAFCDQQTTTPATAAPATAPQNLQINVSEQENPENE